MYEDLNVLQGPNRCARRVRTGLPLFAGAAAFAFVVQWVVFVPSYWAQTEHYYDLTGSLTYLTLALATLLLAGSFDARSVVLTILVSVWALRLGSFLFLRTKRQGIDQRFGTIKPSQLYRRSAIQDADLSRREGVGSDSESEELFLPFPAHCFNFRKAQTARGPGLLSAAGRRERRSTLGFASGSTSGRGVGERCGGALPARHRCLRDAHRSSTGEQR